MEELEKKQYPKTQYIIIIIMSILIMICVTVASTIAYFIDEASDNGSLTLGQVNVGTSSFSSNTLNFTTTELSGGTFTRNVVLNNYGEDCFLRIRCEFLVDINGTGTYGSSGNLTMTINNWNNNNNVCYYATGNSLNTYEKSKKNDPPRTMNLTLDFTYTTSAEIGGKAFKVFIYIESVQTEALANATVSGWQESGINF